MVVCDPGATEIVVSQDAQPCARMLIRTEAPAGTVTVRGLEIMLSMLSLMYSAAPCVPLEILIVPLPDTTAP